MTQEKEPKWIVVLTIDGPHQFEYLTPDRVWSHMLNHAERFATEEDAKRELELVGGTRVERNLE
jgi:hypothetical protein